MYFRALRPATNGTKANSLHNIKNTSLKTSKSRDFQPKTIKNLTMMMKSTTFTTLKKVRIKSKCLSKIQTRIYLRRRIYQLQRKILVISGLREEWQPIFKKNKIKSHNALHQFQAKKYMFRTKILIKQSLRTSS